tara:strand:+ start:271 stop:642 length:372 start_codon:yes stop_codon:yes gene_type:complete
MPLVEVSMVIQNMISPMLESLNQHTAENSIDLPDEIMQQWPIDEPIHEEVSASLAVEKILSVIDEDRMDILETLVRVTMVETEMILVDGILALRMWEHLARTQLASIKSPGQLFSPLDIPEDW